MRKEEIRHDPIRDKIIKYIESVKENQSIVLTIIGLIVIIILTFGYFQNLNLNSSSNASNIAGLGQNNFINGDIDEAIVKFERTIRDFPNTNGALQAYIYLLSDAIKKLDLNKINEIIGQMEDEIVSIDDPVIAAYYYKSKGDIASNNNLSDMAIDNYKLAKKYSPDNRKASYDLDIAIILLKDGKYGDAKTLLKQLLELDDLGFNERNKIEELLAISIQMVET